MFFALSKVAWWLVDPGTLMLLGLVAAVALLYRQRTARWGRRLLLAITAAAVFVAVVPVSGPLLAHLESRFPPRPELPDQVAGIVVLGGVIDPVLTQHYGSPQMNSSIERLSEGAALARRYPAARLIFSGGSGDLMYPERREAKWAAAAFREFGIAAERVEIEEQARNTYQNAVESLRLARPKPGERWILVTSAVHMPRAVGCFRAAGWPEIIPYPVDYRTLAAAATFEPKFDFRGELDDLGSMMHEYLGLLAYRLTGRTDALLPGP